MRTRLLPRCITALLVAMSLLFSQMALANYVCPGTPDMASMAAMMEAGAPCEGMDAAQPVLCHQDAADAAQSFEPVKLAAPSLPMVLLELLLPAASPTRTQLVPPQAEPEQHPPPDPLFLSTLRLRV